MSNIKTVQEIYEAFSKGDVPAIIAKLDENVNWEYDTAPNKLPWLQPLQGNQNVVKFFESLSVLEFQLFQVKEIVGDDKLVVSLLDLEVKVKHNGQIIKEIDEVHIWRFNEVGKVIAFRHRLDTQLQIQTYEIQGMQV